MFFSCLNNFETLCKVNLLDLEKSPSYNRFKIPQDRYDFERIFHYLNSTIVDFALNLCECLLLLLFTVIFSGVESNWMMLRLGSRKDKLAVNGIQSMI